MERTQTTHVSEFVEFCVRQTLLGNWDDCIPTAPVFHNLDVNKAQKDSERLITYEFIESKIMW